MALEVTLWRLLVSSARPAVVVHGMKQSSKTGYLGVERIYHSRSVEKTGEEGHTGGETEHPNREGMQTMICVLWYLEGCEDPMA